MMYVVRKTWLRIHFLANRRRLERELADEIEAHRQMMPEDRRLSFGNVTRLREESHDVWVPYQLQQVWRDLRFGFRVLLRAPGFTLGAIAILAIGIGVNLAEFQIFDATTFHRLNVHDADSILQFSYVSKQGSSRAFPARAVEAYQKASSSFTWLISEDTSLGVVADGETGLRSNLVSSDYFQRLGITPAWGRLLDAHDAQAGATAVAVLGYAYWFSRWDADPHSVGRIIHVNNQPLQIVGVLPYSFDGLAPRRTAIWLPASLRPRLISAGSGIQEDFSRATNTLFGKMKPGLPPAAGDAELTSLTRDLIRQQPHALHEDDRVQGQSVQAAMVQQVVRNPAVAIFVVMVLLILFSACANLGNILLARGLARQREMHIRMALGAGRDGLLRQLMTEDLLLAILGTAAGLACGAVTARLLINALNVPTIHVSLNWPIFVAGAAMIVVSVLTFGLPSALQTVSRNHKKTYLRQTLVGVQVAVSCMLLIASSVMARRGILGAAVDLKFDYQKMIIVDPQLYTRNLPVPVAKDKLDTLVAQLSNLPDVEGVTAAVAPPLGGRLMLDTLPGLPRIFRNAVAPSYFHTMNLPILRGRKFFEGEKNAVIVSESAARAIWPNEDAMGKTWTLAGAERTVTGIVRDSGANLLVDPDSVEAYLPILGPDAERSSLILHSRGDPAQLVHLTAAALLNESPSISLMRTFRENLIDAMGRLVTVIGSLGIVATFLAAAGMFALVAFAVAQREREIGIRIAIGAKNHHILGALLRQNAKPMVAGAIAGVALATVFSRIVSSVVFLSRKEPLDLIGFVFGLACLILVAALATLAPALRALRIDPSVTLRQE